MHSSRRQLSPQAAVSAWSGRNNVRSGVADVCHVAERAWRLEGIEAFAGAEQLIVHQRRGHAELPTEPLQHGRVLSSVSPEWQHASLGQIDMPNAYAVVVGDIAVLL